MKVNECTEKRKKAWMTAGLIGLVSVCFFLKLGALSAKANSVYIFVWIIHFMGIFVTVLLGNVLSGKKISISKCAALGVLLLGSIFMLIIPPNSPPDENYHFRRAYKLSNYLLFQADKDVGNKKDFQINEWDKHQNTSEGYRKIIEKMAGEEEKAEGTQSLSFSIPYPIMYLPQTIGIAIGRLFHAGFLLMFYLGRFFNLLFYAVCIYLAVERVPEKKALFFAVGMMPMALHQAASYSYDGYTNGMAILWTALLFSAVRCDRKMSRREYCILLLTGALMAPAKVGYVVLSCMLFLIPKERFEPHKKGKAIWFLLFGYLGMIMIFWLPTVIKGSGIPTADGEIYSVHTMLKHPFSFLNMVLGTAEDDLIKWIQDAVGRMFSGYSLAIPPYISVLYLIAMFVLALHKKGEKATAPGERNVYCGIIGTFVVLTLLTELFTWTGVDAVRIDGIQGRYFIPIFLLVFLSLDSSSICRAEKTDDLKAFMLLLFLQVLTIDSVLATTMLR